MFGRSCLVTIGTLALMVIGFIVALSSGTPAFSPFFVIVGYSVLLWFGSLAFNHAVTFWKSHDFVPKQPRNAPARAARLNPKADPTSSLLGQ